MSFLITQEADVGRIQGVYIEETGEQYTHGQFIDDTSIIVQSHKRYVDHILSTFRVMGQASSLYIKETRIRAVYISPHPMLDDLKALDWDFEEGDRWSKLLRFHMGFEILYFLSLLDMETMLEKCLHDARLNPYSIPVRVVIANQKVYSTL